MLLLCRHTTYNQQHGHSSIAVAYLFFSVLIPFQITFAPVSAAKVCPRHLFIYLFHLFIFFMVSKHKALPSFCWENL